MKVPSKKTTKRTINADSEKSTIDLEVRIRCRAYELYERRGREDGRDTEDWLQAEAELLIERAKPLADATAKKTREPPAMSTGKITTKQVRKPRAPAQTKMLAE